ncbi:glutamine synthetase cytosolic isozyme 1-2-like isoform X2 [Magnolia sinica]|uniref:glutamine synthetase cytosolic isozyme 1-2-like isoform X2 n=1 Tax=Magnolia sinica TaxID=86752 RepID=UPI002658059D|nr:glutamine synthetase cytosolic isozyme 1-2-like isoform X2 [Magnolia sinica]
MGNAAAAFGGGLLPGISGTNDRCTILVCNLDPGCVSGIQAFEMKAIVAGDWNGAGAHTNYNTKSMRANGGIDVIIKAFEKLHLRHKEHISAYGEGKERRLTSHHETTNINTFSWVAIDCMVESCNEPAWVLSN